MEIDFSKNNIHLNFCMKSKFVCFVNFDFSKISIAVFQKNNPSAIFYKEQGIELIQKKRDMNFANPTTLKVMMFLIQEAESYLNIYIVSVCLIMQNTNIQSKFLNFELQFPSLRKIKLHDLAEIDKHAISLIPEECRMLNIIYDKFIVNNEIFTAQNIINIKAAAVTCSMSAIYINAPFTENIESSLAGFKLNIQHLYSSAISISQYLSQTLSDVQFMVISFGYATTEFCIRNNNAILDHKTINIGIFDVINDIKKVFEVSFDAAKILFLELPNLRNNPNVKVSNPDLTLESVEKFFNATEIIATADARIHEIIHKIFKQHLMRTALDIVFLHGDSLEYTQPELILKGNLGSTKVINLKNSEGAQKYDLTNNNAQLKHDYINMGAFFINQRLQKEATILSKFSCFLKKIFYFT